MAEVLALCSSGLFTRYHAFAISYYDLVYSNKDEYLCINIKLIYYLLIIRDVNKWNPVQLGFLTGS